jgi:hypothetical protein
MQYRVAAGSRFRRDLRAHLVPFEAEQFSFNEGIPFFERRHQGPALGKRQDGIVDEFALFLRSFHKGRRRLRVKCCNREKKQATKHAADEIGTFHKTSLF